MELSHPPPPLPLPMMNMDASSSVHIYDLREVTSHRAYFKPILGIPHVTIHTVKDIDRCDAKYQAQIGNGFSQTCNLQKRKQDTMNISVHGPWATIWYCGCSSFYEAFFLSRLLRPQQISLGGYASVHSW
jgi:hypothetical protein